jgi:hypothetical protein
MSSSPTPYDPPGSVRPGHFRLADPSMPAFVTDAVPPGRPAARAPSCRGRRPGRAGEVFGVVAVAYRLDAVVDFTERLARRSRSS